MLSDTVIKVENLSKQYRIGEHQGYKTFREAIGDAAKVPFNAIRSKLHAPRSTLQAKGSAPHPQSPALNAKSSKLSSNDDTIWALKDVSFEVKRGQVVGLIGRNGAGKSTLLKILSKITEPTVGRVKMKGRIGSLLEVGTGFHPELSGHENIYLYGAILGMDRWEVTRKFDEIVAFAEIEKFIETPVKRYSSGMYTRLAFSVAAHLNPEVLLVDEVLAVGDLGFQKKCLGKMGEAATSGRTVLFVSHNMAAVIALCQRAILLDYGMIVADGCVEAVVKQYRSCLLNRIANNQKSSGVWYEPKDVPFDGARIVKIETIDLKTRKRTERVTTGGKVAFRLHYESEINLPDASFQFGIASLDGVVLIDYYTQPTDGVNTPIKDGPGYVECIFDQFPLAPGDYLMRVGIAHTMVRWLYRSYEFGKLTIEASYNSKGTYAFDSTRGYVQIEHSWRMGDEI